MLYRDCIFSIETTQFLCVEHTQSRCGAGGGRAGGSRTTPTPHWGFPVPPTHTPKIAIPQLRGDNGFPKGTLRLSG